MTAGGLDEAYAHCEALVRAADHASWLAALFAPPDRRPSLHALRAFVIEIGTVRDKVREPLAGELRLQWWTDAIEGESRGDVRGHPVAAALLDTVRARRLSRAALTAFVEAKREDLYDEPIADLAALLRWADRRQGTILSLETAILGEGTPDRLEAIGPAGRAAGIVAAIQALNGPDGHRTEVRLPLDLLNRAGIGTAEVAVRRMSPAIADVVAQLAGAAGREMAALRANRSQIDTRAGPALLTVNFVPALLQQLARRRYDPFAAPLQLPQWRQQWILWRASRRDGVL